VLSAETFRRDGDADADWEAPFGPRDQLARIARLHCPRGREGDLRLDHPELGGMAAGRRSVGSSSDDPIGAEHADAEPAMCIEPLLP
jgi:hypothetical protein